ncbi:hydroxyethylthiazole kinase [Halomonas sp. HL-93]|uniref:hydroxyethylthiazole kinase n=1 Tax=Halomonas sp. HL-93 TaxID=1666906 RepID=UPI0006DB4883|nr:hydroxyethylthiazole kinase [Halomonas sp. HL-93]KPQ23054.1 MAG: hydroxyethylthiazole kinase ThiM [Halomonas sp. HL-93]SBR52130.1 hydroxyethylthiazole kinase [Halomonas sp. HL-93]
MTLPPLGDSLAKLHASTPLVHCITNYVAMNSSANVLLAAGASPAMLHAQEEVAEFTQLAGALSINIGTLSAPWADAMLIAAKTANACSIPWILDPVAVGATGYRQTVCTALLNHQPSVIRANASEILALNGLNHQGRGVDATAATEDALAAAMALAEQYRCVVAMTGERDVITDGDKCYIINGGHPMMPRVTTLGCGLSALVAAFVAATPNAPLDASSAAMACFALAGQRAGAITKGPGSFYVAFLDALYQLTPDELSQFAQREVSHAA